MAHVASMPEHTHPTSLPEMALRVFETEVAMAGPGRTQVGIQNDAGPLRAEFTQLALHALPATVVVGIAAVGTDRQTEAGVPRQRERWMNLSHGAISPLSP